MSLNHQKVLFMLLLYVILSKCKTIYLYEYNLWNDSKPLGNLPPKYIQTYNYDTMTSIQIPVHQYRVVNKKSAEMKPIILSFAANYDIYKLLMFTTSIRKYYDGKVLFFVSETNDTKFYHFLSYFQIDYVNLTNIYPYYSVNNLKYPIYQSAFIFPKRKALLNEWGVIRLFILKEWLRSYGSDYSNFLLCDSRDIIFQGNPFNWNIGNGLYFTENVRGYSIKDSGWNVNMFMNFKYGYKYIDNILLCSGVIYSNYEGIMWWYNKVYSFMENNVIVSDQNNMNYIFYHLSQTEVDDIHIFILCNEYGPVRNLATDALIDEERSKTKDDSMIYNLDKSIPYIIHQYDRNGKLYVDYVKKHCSKYIQYVKDYFKINASDVDKILNNE